MTPPTTALLVVAALAASLLACSDDTTPAAVDPTVAATPAEAGRIAATSLVPGDCLEGITLGANERVEVSEVDLVPCTWPHPVEVYAVLSLEPEGLAEGPGYPGMARVVVASQRVCRTSIAEFTDRPDGYGLLAMWPTRRSWEIGDRDVVCAIFSPSGERFEGMELDLGPEAGPGDESGPGDDPGDDVDPTEAP